MGAEKYYRILFFRDIFIIPRKPVEEFFPAYKTVRTISIKNYFSMIFLLMKWFLRRASERKLFSRKMNFLIQWILFLVNFLLSRRPILLPKKHSRAWPCIEEKWKRIKNNFPIKIQSRHTSARKMWKTWTWWIFLVRFCPCLKSTPASHSREHNKTTRHSTITTSSASRLKSGSERDDNVRDAHQPSIPRKIPLSPTLRCSWRCEMGNGKVKMII